MSKKKFATGLDGILGEEVEKKPIAGQLKETDTRATFIIDKELLQELKAMAYWDRILIKDVINEALRTSRDRYKIIHGEIKPIPKK